jgi:hypothetical protein
MVLRRLKCCRFAGSRLKTPVLGNWYRRGQTSLVTGPARSLFHHRFALPPATSARPTGPRPVRRAVGLDIDPRGGSVSRIAEKDYSPGNT